MPVPRGKFHHNWKGGRTNYNGYILVNIRETEFFDGKKPQMMEHRLIMSRHLGRRLKPDEIVHHKNGIKSDNRLCNLEVLTPNEHAKHHHKKGFRFKIKERACFQCGGMFFPPTTKSRQMYCSIKCGGKARRNIRTTLIKKRKCPHCRIIFEPIFNSEKSRFCSIPCANKSRADTLLERKCPICGKRFFPCTKRNSSTQRFCSISCGVINRGIRKVPVGERR